MHFSGPPTLPPIELSYHGHPLCRGSVPAHGAAKTAAVRPPGRPRQPPSCAAMPAPFASAAPAPASTIGRSAPPPQRQPESMNPMKSVVNPAPHFPLSGLRSQVSAFRYRLNVHRPSPRRLQSPAHGLTSMVYGLSTAIANSITHPAQLLFPHVGDWQAREFVNDALWRHWKFIQKPVPEWQVGAEKPCQNANALHRLRSASLKSPLSSVYASIAPSVPIA